MNNFWVILLARVIAKSKKYLITVFPENDARVIFRAILTHRVPILDWTSFCTFKQENLKHVTDFCGKYFRKQLALVFPITGQCEF